MEINSYGRDCAVSCTAPTVSFSDLSEDELVLCLSLPLLQLLLQLVRRLLFDGDSTRQAFSRVVQGLMLPQLLLGLLRVAFMLPAWLVWFSGHDLQKFK